MIPPKRIIFSGGGAKGCAVVGAMKRFQEAGILSKVKEFAGVSIGAWLAFMFASKLPIEVIERMMLELDFSRIQNLSPETVMGFPETFGLDDGSNLVNLLQTIMRVVMKRDPNMTFADLDTGIQFRCWAADLTAKKSREFSLQSTPNLRIIDALRASMSLPIYFTPVTDPVTGNMLSDGGIHGNIPVYNLNPDEHAEAMYIGFEREVSTDNVTPTDLMGFVGAIFNCLTHARYEKLLKMWNHRILRIPVKVASWNFNITKDEKHAILLDGYTAAEKWMANPPARSIERRQSI